MIFDEPFIDEHGRIVVIIRDNNGNIIGSNISAPISEE